MGHRFKTLNRCINLWRRLAVRRSSRSRLEESAERHIGEAAAYQHISGELSYVNTPLLIRQVNDYTGIYTVLSDNISGKLSHLVILHSVTGNMSRIREHCIYLVTC